MIAYDTHSSCGNCCSPRKVNPERKVSTLGLTAQEGMNKQNTQKNYLLKGDFWKRIKSLTRTLKEFKNSTNRLGIHDTNSKKGCLKLCLRLLA